MEWSVGIKYVKPQNVSTSLARLLDGAALTLSDVTLAYFKLHEEWEFDYEFPYPLQIETALSLRYNSEHFDNLISIAKGYKLDDGVDEFLSKYFISWSVSGYIGFYLSNLEDYLKHDNNPIFKGHLPSPMTYDPKTIITSKEAYPKEVDNQVAWNIHQSSDMSAYFPVQPLKEFKEEMKQTIAQKEAGPEGNPFEGDPMFSENTRFVGTVL